MATSSYQIADEIVNELRRSPDLSSITQHDKIQFHDTQDIEDVRLKLNLEEVYVALVYDENNVETTKRFGGIVQRTYNFILYIIKFVGKNQITRENVNSVDNIAILIEKAMIKNNLNGLLNYESLESGGIKHVATEQSSGFTIRSIDIRGSIRSKP